jgi:hypothetical protein
VAAATLFVQVSRVFGDDERAAPLVVDEGVGRARTGRRTSRVAPVTLTAGISTERRPALLSVARTCGKRRAAPVVINLQNVTSKTG